MIKLHIDVAGKWGILVYYDTDSEDFDEVLDVLIKIGCSLQPAADAAKIVCQRSNTGLTFTNMDLKFSFVCISSASVKSEFVNTIVHELKHVLSHICEYYGVSESGELAAYLIGFLASNVYKLLRKTRFYSYGGF